MSNARALEAGDKLDRYVIEGLLGEGGMGRVYRAVDTKLQRRVALKVVRKEALANPQSQGPARLLREARAAAALDHPSAVAVFDVGEFDGTPYIAMELVDGRPLRALVGDASIALPRRLAWLAEIARVLAAAHARGIVHRDVKPDNVIIRRDDTLKVLDFGIARRINTPTDAHAATTPNELMTLTEEGRRVGTPLYMAPEQISAGAVDGRTDQFAWGVLAWELIAGLSPWGQRDLIGLVSEILNVDPPSPSSVGELGAGLPAAWPPVIARAMRKRPAERFASMNELLAALGGQAPSLPPRRRRSTAAVVAATVVLGVLIVAAGVTGVLVGRARRPRPAPAPMATLPVPLTSLPLPRSSNSAAVAAYRDGIGRLRDGAAQVARADFEEAVALDPTLAAAHLRIALETASSSPTVAREHYQRALANRDKLDERDRELADAIAPHVLSVPPDVDEWQRRMQALVARRPGDAELQLRLGLLYSDRGRFADAVAAFDRALGADPEFGWALWGKGIAAAYLGDFDAARAAYDGCLRVNPAATSCMFGRMELAVDLGDCATHERMARALIAAHPDGAEGSAILARALAARGRKPELIRQTLEQGWRRLDADERARTEPADRLALDSLGGDFADAERQAARLDGALGGVVDETPHADLALALADVLEESGRLRRAGEVARDFLARREAWTRSLTNEDYGIAKDAELRLVAVEHRAGLVSDEAFEAARAQWLDGWSHRLEGDYRGFLWLHGWADVTTDAATARSALEAAARYPKVAPFHPVTLADAEVGRVYLLAGRAVDALPWLRRATANCGAFDHPIRHTRAFLLLGDALAASGDRRGACRAWRRVVERWGAARPASISARQATARLRSGGCDDSKSP
jgi:eukaryotic-like serine/threonine-protein kinase